MLLIFVSNRPWTAEVDTENESLWPDTRAWAEAYLGRMSLEQKVEQMLVAWPDSTSNQTIVRPIRLHGRLAGNRLSPVVVPSAALLAARDTVLAYTWGQLIALRARQAGANAVLIPVAYPGGVSPCVFQSGAVTPVLISHIVRGVQDTGVLAGMSPISCPVTDSTRSTVPDSLRLATIRAAIGAGIMGAEIPDSLLTGTRRPLGLGRRPATLAGRNLRRSFGFSGLAMTQLAPSRPDDMVDHARNAIDAGIDLLIVRNNVAALQAAMTEAIRDGKISRQAVDASVLRILQAKKWLGLIGTDQPRPAQVLRTLPDLERISRRTLASESLTLIRNAGDVLPLPGRLRRMLVVQVSDGDDAAERRAFPNELRRERIGVAFTVRSVHINSDAGALRRVLQLARGYESVLLASFVDEGRSARIPDSFRTFADSLVALPGPAILVAFRNTTVPEYLPNAESILISWDDGPEYLSAVAEALFGRVQVRGVLPYSTGSFFPVGSQIELAQIAPRRGIPEDVGLDGRLLDRVDSLMKAAIAHKAFPGAAVVVGRGGTIVKMKGYGRFTYDSRWSVTTRSQFDLASLTKVVATTVATMKLYEQGRIGLDDRVSKYLPSFSQGEKVSVTIRQLLSHTSGLPASLSPYPQGLTRDQVVDAILSDSLTNHPGTEFLYSDEGMIVLGLVIERITGQDLATYVREQVFTPLRMYSTGYRSVGFPDSSIVPTEVDSTFRKRLVQGEVHDELAYMMGGTAGNAGLFSTAEDLAKFSYMMVNNGRIFGRQFLKPETIRLFTTRIDPTGRSTRTLGWDTRSQEGYSSAGIRFGPRSYGHTGFTGTSLWIDPDARLFVVLLSNRVYPTRDNQRHVAIRAELADLAYEAIRGPIRPLLLTSRAGPQGPLRM